MSMLKETLDKYRKYGSIFIETGSFEGNTIQLAIESNFKQIHSIELAEGLYQKCKERFKDNSNVFLHHGDCLQVLPKLLKTIHEPCVFWLDAHFSFGETAKGDVYSPIYQELDLIKAHEIKKHCILIDDLRLFTTEFELQLDLVKQKLLQINPKYSLKYENGVVDNDILVAYL